MPCCCNDVYLEMMSSRMAAPKVELLVPEAYPATGSIWSDAVPSLFVVAAYGAGASFARIAWRISHPAAARKIRTESAAVTPIAEKPLTYERSFSTQLV